MNGCDSTSIMDPRKYRDRLESLDGLLGWCNLGQCQLPLTQRPTRGAVRASIRLALIPVPENYSPGLSCIDRHLIGWDTANRQGNSTPQRAIINAFGEFRQFRYIAVPFGKCLDEHRPLNRVGTKLAHVLHH